jgi:sulfoxide reductase heme-binding subunit YedZ
MNKLLLHPAAKPVVFLLCLLPFAWLAYGAFTDGLGANPGVPDPRDRRLDAALHLHRAGGDAAARHQQMERARALPPHAGPVRVLLRGAAPLCYSWFDMGFEWGEIAKDIAKRPFILVGFSAFVLLTPLAATSFNRAIKAMGAKRWQMLHKLVYVIAGLGLLHFFWMRAGKNNFAEVFVYAAIIAVLLGWRVWNYASKRKAKKVPAGARGGEKPLRSTS